MDLKNFFNNNNKIISIGFFIILFISLHYIYFKLDINATNKFKELIATYGSFGIILTIYSIYKSNEINYSNIINTELNSLNQLFQNITQTCSNFFLNNSNMKYYYNELFEGVIHQDDIIRNKNMEQILSNNILINIDALINYIDSYKLANGTNFQLKIMEDKLLKLLKRFMKSPIFVENWHKFKDIFALEWTKTYMQIYFNE